MAGRRTIGDAAIVPRATPDDHVLGIGEFEQSGNQFGGIGAISVGNDYVRRSGGVDPDLERRTVPAIVVEPNHTRALGLGFERGAIRRAIVDDHDVEREWRIGESRQHALDDRANAPGLVVGGDDHRDVHLGTGVPR